MERVTADELRRHAGYLRNLPMASKGTVDILERAADTLEEMDKDIAVFETRDADEHTHPFQFRGDC